MTQVTADETMVLNCLPSIEQIESWLEAVKDPEIPVISIKALGIYQNVVWQDDTLHVNIIPTYSGCPAMHAIKQDIVILLKQKGIDDVQVHVNNSPIWSTDMISEAGREQMRAFGIAPPKTATQQDIACPLCQSKNTKLLSQFSSTSCKALYRCNDCLEPFDYFKCYAPIS